MNRFCWVWGVYGLVLDWWMIVSDLGVRGGIVECWGIILVIVRSVCSWLIIKVDWDFLDWRVFMRVDLSWGSGFVRELFWVGVVVIWNWGVVGNLVGSVWSGDVVGLGVGVISWVINGRKLRCCWGLWVGICEIGDVMLVVGVWVNFVVVWVCCSLLNVLVY